MTTIKYLSDYRKYRYKQQVKQTNKQTKNLSRIFIREKLAIQVIMDCRTAAHKFGTGLTLKQYDIILAKQRPVLTKINGSFEVENIPTQYSVLCCSIGLYLNDYVLAIKIDENRTMKQKDKQQQNKNLVVSLFEMILTDNFDFFKVINEIFRHINRLFN